MSRKCGIAQDNWPHQEVPDATIPGQSVPRRMCFVTLLATTLEKYFFLHLFSKNKALILLGGGVVCEKIWYHMPQIVHGNQHSVKGWSNLLVNKEWTLQHPQHIHITAVKACGFSLCFSEATCNLSNELS